MTDEAIIKALAELDGFTFQSIKSLIEQGKYTKSDSPHVLKLWITISPNGCFLSTHDLPFDKYGLPDYLTDYNPILKLIQKQSLEIKRAIAQQLLMIQESFYMLDATPRRLCIVTLKSVGKWEE